MRSPRLTTSAGRGAALAALAIMLLTGCGGGSPEASGDEASAGATTAETSTTQPGSSAPSEFSASPTATRSGSPSGSESSLPNDWRPEEPTVLATGQKVPDDYEAAALEHPARNVPRPVMPAEAREETEAGAQAFLHYRADAHWYAMQTGDTSLVREVTALECSNCTEQFDEIDELYRDGGWARGGWEEVTLPRGHFIKRADGGYNFPVEVDSKGFQTVVSSQVRVTQMPFSGNDLLDIYMDFRDGHWTHVTASPRGSL